MDKDPEYYRKLQEELRRAWEDLEYAHTWLIATDWNEDTNVDDKLTAAGRRARAYSEIVDRATWIMRRG